MPAPSLAANSALESLNVHNICSFTVNKCKVDRKRILYLPARPSISGMIPEMSVEEYADVSALTQEEFSTTGGFRWLLLPSSTETASRTLLWSACIFHPAVSCYMLWVTNKIKPNNIYKNKSMLVKSMWSYQLHTRKFQLHLTVIT